MNTVIISGNLGANPEVRTTASGLAVANLSVATNERVKQDGEWTDHTERHRVTVFGKQAEVCGKFLGSSPTRTAVTNGPPRFSRTTSSSWAKLRPQPLRHPHNPLTLVQSRTTRSPFREK